MTFKEAIGHFERRGDRSNEHGEWTGNDREAIMALLLKVAELEGVINRHRDWHFR